MHNFVHDMLHNVPAAQRMEALWKECFVLTHGPGIAVVYGICNRSMKKGKPPRRDLSKVRIKEPMVLLSFSMDVLISGRAFRFGSLRNGFTRYTFTYFIVNVRLYHSQLWSMNILLAHPIYKGFLTAVYHTSATLKSKAGRER